MLRFWRNPERVIFGLLWIAQGCLVGPDFKTPPALIADRWVEQGNKAVNTRASEYRDWWEVFNDPRLTRLVQLAYQQNLTLQTAGVRVLEARARLGIAIGEFYPQQQQVGASLTYNRIPVSLPYNLAPSSPWPCWLHR
jgi:outer membrane protein TolC